MSTFCMVAILVYFFQLELLTSEKFELDAVRWRSIRKRGNLQNQAELPMTCADFDENSSGIHQIQPQLGFEEPLDVVCDQNFEGGGWTVIQNRFNGSVDFYRGWDDYESGFGDLRGEFWLGLRKIHQLTYSKAHELRIVLEDFDGISSVARYDYFQIAGPEEQYQLVDLGRYSGDAGDSLSYHIGMKFTTLDVDNDMSEGNCAIEYHGAWWYKKCHNSHLNGKYLRGKTTERWKGICWQLFRGPDYSLKVSRMMIRPRKML
ncbi:ficolin-1-like [Uranotaenia lowii]|uniref:ficolin-1-like n=1 Tax=Uranotaenia lowii TaxID=190385 RepID=UPI002479CADD|nr:ficolin-1-like [Uranotaenia lowii]